MYTKLIEQEKRKLERIKKRIKSMNTNVADKRQSRRDIGMLSPRQSRGMELSLPAIRLWENRIELLHKKVNETKSLQNQMKEV